MGARSAVWRAALLLAIPCTTTHAGEPSWADVLAREAAARPGMDERGAPRSSMPGRAAASRASTSAQDGSPACVVVHGMASRRAARHTADRAPISAGLNRGGFAPPVAPAAPLRARRGGTSYER